VGSDKSRIPLVKTSEKHGWWERGLKIQGQSFEI